MKKYEDSNEKADAAAEKMLDILLALAPEDRGDAFSSLQFNEVVCVHCGDGERTTPNARCQCTNDE